MCWDGCVEDKLNKGTMAAVSTLSPEIVALTLAPLALALKLVSLVPLWVSLVLSKLLLLVWSLEQVFLCTGPLRTDVMGTPQRWLPG